MKKPENSLDKKLHYYMKVLKIYRQHLLYFIPFAVAIAGWFFLFYTGKLQQMGMGAFLYLLVLAPLVLLAMKGHKLVKQNLALTAHDVNVEQSVLYLRSFSDDEKAAKKVKTGWLKWDVHTEDEHIADAFKEIGLFFAISNPQKNLQELGPATRKEGDDWLEKVKEYMQKSRLVVIRIGSSNNLITEIKSAIALVPSEKLIFLVTNEAEIYNDFRKKTKDIFTYPLPDYIQPKSTSGSLNGIIYFKPDWIPQFVSLEKHSTLESKRRKMIAVRMKMALKPVYEQLRVPWKKPSGHLITLILKWFLIIQFILILIIIIAVLVGKAIG